MWADTWVVFPESQAGWARRSPQTLYILNFHICVPLQFWGWEHLKNGELLEEEKLLSSAQEGKNFETWEVKERWIKVRSKIIILTEWAYIMSQSHTNGRANISEELQQWCWELNSPSYHMIYKLRSVNGSNDSERKFLCLIYTGEKSWHENVINRKTLLLISHSSETLLTKNSSIQ